MVISTPRLLLFTGVIRKTVHMTQNKKNLEDAYTETETFDFIFKLKIQNHMVTFNYFQTLISKDYLY